MRPAVLVLAALVAAPLHAAELRGPWRPVRALAIADAETVISGSFDTTVILWSLPRSSALSVRQFHAGSVNAVAALPGGRFAQRRPRTAASRCGTATGRSRSASSRAIPRPVVDLAVAADGTQLASASWDGTARIWPQEGGEPRVLSGHQGNVNGIAFMPDGRIATAGYDATLRLWPEDGPPVVRTLPTPLNTLAVLPDGRLALGGGDGHLRLVSAGGEVTGEVAITETPVTALAVSPDGSRLAAAGIRGAIAVVSAATLKIERTLVGPGLPVWSLAFTADSRDLLTGGTDRVIRRWNAVTGELAGPVVAGAPPDPLAAYEGDRGAEVFRACVACHTLQPGQGMRAGPSLHGIMGRRIGTLPGYVYSPGFRDLDIVWSKETIARLFEIGPHTYTPGTKMPEQTVNRAEDRQALVDFLDRATR